MKTADLSENKLRDAVVFIHNMLDDIYFNKIAIKK